MSELSQNVWQQAKLGQWDALKSAIKSNSGELDIDFVYGPSKESFLHLSAVKGNDEICKLLIEKGCNLNAANSQGITALYMACAADAPAVVSTMMSNGANPNTLISASDISPSQASKDWIETCRKAPSPLHVAALRGHAEVVDILLKFDELNANATNESNDTALHLACEKGNVDVVRALARRPNNSRNTSGATPLDLCKTDELRAILSDSGASSSSSGKHGGAAGTPTAAHKEDPAVILGRCGSEVPEMFGRDLALQLYSDNWKNRMAGTQALTELIKNAKGVFGGARVTDEAFEATCAVVTDLIHDKNQKVFQASLRALNEFLATDTAKKLPISEDDLHPAVELLYIALLKKMESAQARQANAAMQAILDLVMASPVLSVSSLVELVYAYDPNPPTKHSKDTATTPTNRGSSNWRPLHARLRILGELVKSLGDREGTGLALDRTLDVALPSLENASVQVRKSALEITATVLATHAKSQHHLGEDAGGSSSIEEAVLEIKEEYLGPPLKSAVMKQVMSKLCKMLKVKIHKSASSSKSKSKKGKKSSKSKSRSSGGGSDAVAEADGDAGEHEFDVQELSPQQAKEFADVTSEFGKTVSQYIASSNWQARKRGIKMIVDILREVKDEQSMFVGNARRLKAGFTILYRALVDTVQHIYVSGLKLVRFFGELSQKESRKSAGKSPTPVETFFDAMTSQVPSNLLPIIISKFANTKERVRKQTHDTLMSLSRLGSNASRSGGAPSSNVGLEHVVASLVDAIDHGSDKDSTYLVASRLETLCTLLTEHNVPVSKPGQSSAGFSMDASKIVAMASAALKARDRAARATADSLFEYLCRKMGRAVLEELPELTENGQLRLKACLAKVETLQNFEAVSLRQPAAGSSGRPGAPRPGASSGRPGASSGRPGAPSGRPDRASLSSRSGRSPSPGGGRESLNSRRARLQSAAGPRACDLITKLPHADTVPSKLSNVAAPMYAWFGEALTRCLLSQDWNLRNTGIIVLRTRMLQACGMVPQEQITDKDSIPAHSLDIVEFTIGVVARACDDRIAKVYESALDLLHVLATNYVAQLLKAPKAQVDEETLVQMFTPAVVGILPKLNHRNERLRYKSEQLLLHLCRISYLGPRLISTLIADVDAFTRRKFSGPTLVGIFALVRLVIEEFGIGSKSGFDPDKLMEVLVPALENKHVDVRKSATELYAVLYLAVGDNAQALNELISGLKPQVKAKCTSAVNLLKTKHGGNSPIGSPKGGSRSRSHSGAFGSVDDEKQKHQGLMRERMKEEEGKLTPIFGKDAAKNLCNPDSWETRATALSDLSNALLDGEALPNVRFCVLSGASLI